MAYPITMGLGLGHVRTGMLMMRNGTNRMGNL